MSSQSPYDPYNQSVPPAQPVQSHEYEFAASGERPTNPPLNLYAQNLYAQQSPYAYPAPPVNDASGGLAIAGLILGIISVLSCFIPIFGAVVAIPGIVLSVLGRRSVSRKGIATAGLVLSIISIVLTIGILVLGGVFFYITRSSSY